MYHFPFPPISPANFPSYGWSRVGDADAEEVEIVLQDFPGAPFRHPRNDDPENTEYLQVTFPQASITIGSVFRIGYSALWAYLCDDEKTTNPSATIAFAPVISLDGGTTWLYDAQGLWGGTMVDNVADLGELAACTPDREWAITVPETPTGDVIVGLLVQLNMSEFSETDRIYTESEENSPELSVIHFPASLVVQTNANLLIDITESLTPVPFYVAP